MSYSMLAEPALAALLSLSVSRAFRFFMHSLIWREAVASLLLCPVDYVFIVMAFIQRLFGSSIGGNDIVLPPVVWKLILRKVHWP